MKTMKIQRHGLARQFVELILLSALASFVLLGVMQVVLNKALRFYFGQTEIQQAATERQVEDLQEYLDARNVSSREISKLDDWALRHGATLFMVYDDSGILYSSYQPMIYQSREDSGDGSVVTGDLITVTDAPPDSYNWLPAYTLTFADKKTKAVFYYNGVDAYYGKGCEILLIISFVAFPLFFLLGSRKIVSYILKLSDEIQAMEGGDLDHPITVRGEDELTVLASCLDSMRLTLRQQQEQEAQAAAKVKSLITEMSHDLRTPLTTLMLYTEILRHHKYETAAQEAEYLTKVDEKARQIKQLSDNLFEYALVTRDTVVKLDAPARFSQIFEEPLAELVDTLQQRGFVCALELGEDDVMLTVKGQYIRRILDNISSNIQKYADPAQAVEVHFIQEAGQAGLVFRNYVLSVHPVVESTKVGLTSIETMMDKMHGSCRVEQDGETFAITLLFPLT